MSVLTDTERQAAPPRRFERLRRRALALAFNPLLVRDLRSLLRGRRPLWLQVGYTCALMAAMGIAAYACWMQQSSLRGASATALYGQFMFYAMHEVQVGLIALVVVAYGAGSIALEYEKRTYEMLAVTTLSTLEIVIGKIASITALSWMMLLTSVPLAALCLMLGGVSPGQILLSYLLLAYIVPLWAAIGVLVSILASRTIGSYVVTLLCVGGWLIGATYLSGVGGPSDPFLGTLSPIVAPFTEITDRFQLFRHSLPAWLPALVLNGLLAALATIAAAEAMPLHAPKRSPLLRGLLLAFLFCYLFLLASAIIQTMLPPAIPGGLGAGGPAPTMSGPLMPGSFGGPPSPASPPSFSATALSAMRYADPPLFPFLRAMLLVSLLIALITVPIFGSYVPPKEVRTHLVGWVFGPVSPRRWLAREANVGWRSNLILLAVTFAAAVLPVLIADRTHALGQPTFSIYNTAMLLFGLALYAVSLTGYSLLTTGFAASLRDRRVAALCSTMVILILNVIGVYYIYNPYDSKKLQFLAHPAVALLSPVAAVHAVLTPGFQSVYWADQWGSPVYAIGLAFLYPVLLLVGSLLYLHTVSRRARAEASEV